jgi:hypothetical protein
MQIRIIDREDRRSMILNTSQALKLSPAIVEKDLWVTLALDYLFHRCPYAHAFLFKGGTSLSKAYSLISRFSEDLDLILDWRVLGYEHNEPWNLRSNTKQDLFNKEANARASTFIAGELKDKVDADLKAEWGADTRVETDAQDSQTLLVHYPRLYDQDGLLQVIRLEIGPLAAWTPFQQAKIRAFADESYGGLIDGATTTVSTVSPERTFWEKATILHHEANRPAELAIPDRYSRHYYDLYRMIQSPVRQKALENIDLLKQVATFKKKFYPRSWAKYDDATPNSLKLIPPEMRRVQLAQDYRRMQLMLFGPIPSFEDIMHGLTEFESELHMRSTV